MGVGWWVGGWSRLMLVEVLSGGAGGSGSGGGNVGFFLSGVCQDVMGKLLILDRDSDTNPVISLSKKIALGH